MSNDDHAVTKHGLLSGLTYRRAVLGGMTVGALKAVGLLSASAFAQERGITGNAPPTDWSDPNAELALKISEPFTVADVGDIIEMQPFTHSSAPDVQQLVTLLRGADVTLANMEATVVDLDTYDGPRGPNLGNKSVADDMAAMGINMVTKANNHTLDAGLPGLEATFRQLERVGIVHGGAGKSLTEARSPVFHETVKGRVGMVGVYANANAGDRESVAQDEVQGFGGQPGANTLRLTQLNGVTSEQMAQLRAMNASIQARRSEVEYPDPEQRDHGPDRLSLFGTDFKISDRPGEYSYNMNHADLAGIMSSIKSGKQSSDCLVAQIHWHQNRFAFQHYSFDNYPADYEIAFAHAAIDHGADVLAAHGVHTLKGIEIYKNKPIFYGLSNFVFQTEIMPGPTPPDMSLGEFNAKRWGWLQTPANLISVIAVTHFDKGRLMEVRLHPVDLGYDRHGSQMGTPRVPSHDVAQRILAGLQTYSQPFGTKIALDGDVGVIRLQDTDDLPNRKT